METPPGPSETTISSPPITDSVYNKKSAHEATNHSSTGRCKSDARLRCYLEEVVFEEISHRFVCRNGPPGVEVEVENVKPGDEHQGGQLGLVADRDQNHQNGANQVLNDLQTHYYVLRLSR